MTTSRRYILKTDPLIKISERAILIPKISFENDWALVGFYQATAEAPKHTTYRSQDEAHQIHFVADEYIQTEYVVVDGPQPEEVLKQAKRPVPCYDDEELWNLAETATEPREHIRSLYYLGVSSPHTLEQRRVDHFIKMTKNKISEVRKAAIVAMGYADWDPLTEELTRIANVDPDPLIRAHADSLREGYKQKSMAAR